jgi:tRNA threonylcarbamoyladenosine biosynthesis protein TsaB
MPILSIETSSKVCSVAIHHDGKLLANQTIFTEKASSGMLTPIIRQVLDNNNLKPKDLDAVAVAMGPGSYTGLRIAVSTAKGLCMACEKPLIAINTLEAMALQVKNYFPEKTLFCPMLDARRMEVYCAVYDKNMNCVEATNAKVIDESSFTELLRQNNVVFFGEGAEKCKETLAHNKNVHFLNETVWPSATTVGYLAYEKFEKGIFENLVTFEPFYLKDFIGTIKVDI